MGGESPHLGLVLTEGALSGYSVERDLSQISNDRGDFLLHPSPMTLAPKRKLYHRLDFILAQWKRRFLSKAFHI